MYVGRFCVVRFIQMSFTTGFIIYEISEVIDLSEMFKKCNFLTLTTCVLGGAVSKIRYRYIIYIKES